MRLPISLGLPVLAALVSTSLGAEQSFPVVDVDAWCAKASPREPIGRASCVRREQDSYEFARALWPALSMAGQARCADMMRATSGAEYLLLASCIQGEFGRERNERDRVVTPRFRP